MNPILGIFFHAIGGFAASSFYIPITKLKIGPGKFIGLWVDFLPGC